MQAYDNDACDDAVLAEDAFARSRAAFAELAATLGGAEAGGWTHDQLEDHLERDGRQLLRRLLQDHLDLRADGARNLYPADAALNLPDRRHSHTLKRRAATEAVRGSFEAAEQTLTRSCGKVAGKRQVEQLTVAAAG